MARVRLLAELGVLVWARSSRDSRVAHQPEDRGRSAIDRAILQGQLNKDIDALMPWAYAAADSNPSQ